MAKVVTFGEVMLRLSTPGYLRFSQARQFEATFGGGEANVAVSLANYGVDARFVTRLPKNDIADMCVAELRGLGVGVDDIVYGGDRVGIYYLETGAVARGSKVIYDRANSAISEIKPGMVDWHKVLEGADWFHWTGITPALSQGAADACLEAIKTANEMGVKVSCDLNYRKKLWKYGKSANEVMPALVEGCDLILGNEEDAEKDFGIKPEGFDAEKTGGAAPSTPTTTPGAACYTTARPSGSQSATTSPTSSIASAVATPLWAASSTASSPTPPTRKQSNSPLRPPPSSTPSSATTTASLSPKSKPSSKAAAPVE